MMYINSAAINNSQNLNSYFKPHYSTHVRLCYHFLPNTSELWASVPRPIHCSFFAFTWKVRKETKNKLKLRLFGVN